MGEKKNMPAVWFSLKRSLHCKTEPSEVHEPKTKKQLGTILTRKAERRSGCSRSIANLRDVIHGSKRHLEKPPTCSPRSIGSSDFLNPITHEVILSNSTCELKITSFGGLHDGGGDGGGSFLGTLRPGTPGPGGHPTMHYFNSSYRNPPPASPPRRTSALMGEKEMSGFASKPCRASSETDSNRCSVVTCHKCGEQFGKWEALEAHHLSKHAGNLCFSIFHLSLMLAHFFANLNLFAFCFYCSTVFASRSSWVKSESQCGRIERVLKVHNTQKTLARFEEYREMVKMKASKLPKKHPRCLADGNELLRFYGTTVACCLGMDGCCSLCASDKCCVCRIIRSGFSTKKELKGGIGVFTTSTSGRAFECRVHRPLENIQEMAGQTGFDSLAGKVGLYSNIEELYLLNPRALLPCFVVICKS
nr:Zinc finger and BTB domain-containing 16 [Ipomoea batatas]